MIELRMISNIYKVSTIMLIAVGSAFAVDTQTANSGTNPETLLISEVRADVHAVIGPDKVVAAVRARPGQQFSRETSMEDTKLIAKIPGVRVADYFVEIINNQVVLTYVARTDPLIRNIIFNGNEKVKPKKLLKELGIKTNDFLDLPRVRTGVKDLTKYYLKNGYPFVQVELDEASLSTEGVANVVYNIDEGPRCRVRHVFFEGNNTLTTRKLKKVPDTKIAKYVVLPCYFDRDKLDADLGKLQEVYQNFGFLNAKIQQSVEFSDDHKGASVTFIIEEGPVFYVEDILVEGSQVYGYEDFAEDFKLVQGEAFGQNKADFDLKKILGKHRQDGYVDAAAKFEREVTPDNKVIAKYDIDAGTRYRVGRISITGNNEVHDKVVRAILDEEGFTPGQWYDASTASGDGEGELERLVKDTVLAKTVTIEPGEKHDEYRDAQVNVIESKTGSIMFGAGVNSNFGLLGNITLDQRNFDITDTPESWKDLFTGKAFKGAGQRFKISLSPGTSQSSYLVSFGDSYVYDKPIAFETSLSMFDRIQEVYDETRSKAYLGFVKRYSNQWRRGVSFRVEQVDVQDIDTTAPQEIKDFADKNNLFGVKFSLGKDTTDDLNMPTRGYNFDVGYEQVAGEKIFGVLGLTQRWYKTLYEDLAGRKTVLETKFQAATIIGDAPFFERFYAGGTGSIRGFEYRGVSTRGKSTNTTSTVEEDPIGSQWIITANAEVVYPLETKSLSWLFFIDTGMIDQGGIRTSVGTGIQLMMPQWFGPVPMRLEIAAPIMKDSRDETRIFSFSAGALF